MLAQFESEMEKNYYHCSYLTPNPVLLEKQSSYLPESPNMLSNPKDELADLHRTLQKFIFFTETNHKLIQKQICLLEVLT